MPYAGTLITRDLLGDRTMPFHLAHPALGSVRGAERGGAV